MFIVIYEITEMLVSWVKQENRNIHANVGTLGLIDLGNCKLAVTAKIFLFAA